MPQASTQDFLAFKEIKEGVLILKDNSLRAILMVSSVNFALKSAEEQEAILYQFQNFLNSLDFSIQIIVQSRILNLTGYLDKLKELEEKQKNEQMKIQTAEYRNFISQLVASRQILTKMFYIVIPFTLIQLPKVSVPTTQKGTILSEEDFARAKSQLWQRVEFVSAGLRGCGLQNAPLNTLEIIELLWGLHHLNEAEIGYYPEIPPEIIR
ncbi:MAG: hypothetical protein ACPLW9_02305 [Minisyncoccales bacterium]